MKLTGLGTGSVVNLNCNEPFLPEFPGLHFGVHSDGCRYFDATDYIQQNPDQQLSVKGFISNFNFQINAIADSFQIPQEQIVIINTEGHQLIAGCLCYLFMCYAQPWLNAYLYDRIDELFTMGVAISDSYTAQTVRRRFTPEVLKSIFSEDGENPA